MLDQIDNTYNQSFALLLFNPIPLFLFVSLPIIIGILYRINRNINKKTRIRHHILEYLENHANEQFYAKEKSEEEKDPNNNLNNKFPFNYTEIKNALEKLCKDEKKILNNNDNYYYPYYEFTIWNINLEKTIVDDINLFELQRLIIDTLKFNPTNCGAEIAQPDNNSQFFRDLKLKFPLLTDDNINNSLYQTDIPPKSNNPDKTIHFSIHFYVNFTNFTIEVDLDLSNLTTQ